MPETVSPADCERMRELYADGLSTSQIGPRVGYHPATARKHVHERCEHEVRADGPDLYCQDCDTQYAQYPGYLRHDCTDDGDNGDGEKADAEETSQRPRAVTAAQCDAMRERAADGAMTAVIGDAFGYARRTAAKHIHGRCSHKGGERSAVVLDTCPVCGDGVTNAGVHLRHECDGVDRSGGETA